MWSWEMVVGILLVLFLVSRAIRRNALKAKKETVNDFHSFLLERLGLALGFDKKGLQIEMLQTTRYSGTVEVCLSRKMHPWEPIELEKISQSNPVAKELLIILASYGADKILSSHLRGQAEKWSTVLRELNS